MSGITKKKWTYILLGVILLISFLFFQNNSLVITEYTLQSEKLPESFTGYKMVQLSDLHSKTFGDEQKKLIKRIEKVNPDLIVFTGDLVDSKSFDEENSLVLMKGLIQIAPVYFVTGNHEWWSGAFDSLELKLTNAGVHVLRNTLNEVHIGEDKIQIFGIDDPAKEKHVSAESTIRNDLHELEGDTGEFRVLLSHRPEFLSVYADFNFDLVFSGHAHGGQFRLPLVGGIIAPNQGLFPEYDAGDYILSHTTMIVNRGLGNSVIPFRLFNRPEIVVVTMESVNN